MKKHFHSKMVCMLTAVAVAFTFVPLTLADVQFADSEVVITPFNDDDGEPSKDWYR